MQAGKLRHRFAVQSITAENLDAAGQPQPTWTTAATRWGSLEALSGRELIQAQTLAADVTHRITLRHYSGLTAAFRLTHAGRTFAILEVLNPEDRDVETRILARETTIAAA